MILGVKELGPFPALNYDANVLNTLKCDGFTLESVGSLIHVSFS